MIFSASCHRISSLIGNVLEHYDTALFALLAPFIAPFFFDSKDPVMALILTYAILPLGLLTKPLGSLFFGWIGDRLGRRKALFYSLSGTASISMMIGLLPTYQTIGIWAPVLLSLGRMLQGFFSVGESIGAALFLLEHSEKKQRNLFSSFFDISSLLGMFVASMAVSLMSFKGCVEQNWRILFLAGGVTAILGLFLRYSTKESSEYTVNMKSKTSLISILQKHKIALLCVMLASGFAHTTYSLAFTFMNAFVPLITPITRAEVTLLHTKLLIADMILLLCFGYLAHKVGKEKVMLTGSLLVVILGIPLFALLPNASILTVTLIRLCIIICGVAFAAPYYAWALEQAPTKHRYLILGLGSALGSQLIGAPSTAICLWLYKITNYIFAPGLYLSLAGLGATIAIYVSWQLKPSRSLSTLP